MLDAAALWLTSAAAVFASPVAIGHALTDLKGGDLILVHDPHKKRPVEMLVALRVRAPVHLVRTLLATPATFQTAIPTFRRIEVLQPTTESGGMNVAWELEIPLWNLQGQLRFKPNPEGVELVLHQGDLAPGRFRLCAYAEGLNRTLLVLESAANVKEANWIAKRIINRLALGEPAIAATASYVLLKALALYFEQRSYHRSTAAMETATLASLGSPGLAGQAPNLIRDKTFVAVIHNRLNGRFDRVEAAFPVKAHLAKVNQYVSTLAMFQAFPGWKDTSLEKGSLPECRDPKARCYVVDSSLPFFDLDATWKVWAGIFRARAVAENLAGAVMALDPLAYGSGTLILLSQSLGLHKSGYFARKLIASEPLLEQGLALARILMDTVSIAQALDEL